jgi:hypothetical protein
MKVGRPTCHIKANWITLGKPDVSLFFLFSVKEDLFKVNGEIMLHQQAVTVAVTLNPVQEQSDDLFIPDDVQPVFERSPAKVISRITDIPRFMTSLNRATL